jgi:nucleoside-diphosphate-sugar epimerase
VRIFLTGATGYIGNAVALALRARDHEVTALVRASADSGQLRDRGVVLITGDLGSLPSLADSVSEHDAYIHTAFSPTADAVALDRTAVDIFTSAGGYFLFTSGVWVLGNSTGGKRMDEDSPTNPLPLVAWRPAHEQMVLRSGKNGVLRPGIVYGGRQSIAAAWFAAADQKRPVEIVGDGGNRWPWVHVEELAQLYARAVEQKAAGIFHGIDDTDATVRKAAEAVGPVTSKDMEGPYAEALKSNQIVSSEKTRRKLGWNPRKTFTSTIDEQWREFRAAR